MRLSATNPLGRVLAVVLLFEAVTFGLAIPGMIGVAGVPVATASAVGGAACLLALTASASLRRPPGYLLGWLTQAAGVALGVLTPWMFGLGGVFALLWIATFVLGRRLETAG